MHSACVVESRKRPVSRLSPVPRPEASEVFNKARVRLPARIPRYWSFGKSRRRRGHATIPNALGSRKTDTSLTFARACTFT